MELLKLVGVLIIIVGFVLRLRVTVVVVVAGIVTGLVAGMPFVGTEAAPGIVDTLGRSFANQRIITLFVLSLPAIGLSERYGLQDRARTLIRRIRAATAGRLEVVFLLLRYAIGAMGIRLGSGHVALGRPLILPMALGAEGLDAEVECDADAVDEVKAATGAAENYGNFFGQNLFFGAAGVALVVTTLADLGYAIDPRRVALWTIPVATSAAMIGAVQFLWLDRSLRRLKSGNPVADAPGTDHAYADSVPGESATGSHSDSTDLVRSDDTEDGS
jgi:uncharacterized membrane protein